MKHASNTIPSLMPVNISSIWLIHFKIFYFIKFKWKLNFKSQTFLFWHRVPVFHVLVLYVNNFNLTITSLFSFLRLRFLFIIWILSVLSFISAFCFIKVISYFQIKSYVIFDPVFKSKDVMNVWFDSLLLNFQNDHLIDLRVVILVQIL